MLPSPTRAPGWRETKILLLLCVLLAALGTSSCMGNSTSANGGPPPPIPSAAISFCDDGTASCTPANSFSVASLRDLVININWENLPDGNHLQSLEILIPGGGLYQSTETAFLTESPSPHTFSAMRLLPVAGTWISQRQITGDWTVRVSLDGQLIATEMVQLNP